MVFRKLFAAISSAFTRDRAATPTVEEAHSGDGSAVPGTAAVEPVARYLTSQGHCTATRVKAGAFMPPSDLMLSTYVVDGLKSPEVHALGMAIFPKPPRGFALLLTTEPLSTVGLTITRDDEPPRHANIVGWPAEKDEQMSLAQELASAATLHLSPPKA